MNVQKITADSDIEKCFEAFAELRPHLKNRTQFVGQVKAQSSEGYQIHAIFDGNVAVSCVGLRVMTTLAWGKILYVDDLITAEKHRGKGYGSILLKHAVDMAGREGCQQVHLDTGYGRHAAHRTYLKHGFQLNCHHLALDLR